MRTRALLTSLMVPAATVALAAISAAPASAAIPASLETHAASSIVALPPGVLGGQFTCHVAPGTYSATSDSWSCDYAAATASASAITTLGLLCADGTTTYAADRAVFTCSRADVATG